MRKKVLILVLLLAQLQVYSQWEKLPQFWNEFAFTKDLTRNRVVEINGGLSSSSAPANSHILHNISQLYVRSSAYYHPVQRWKLSVFYAYFHNKYFLELNQEKAPELRSSLQGTYSLLKEGRFKVNLLWRFENRHLKKESANFETIKCLRFQIKGIYPPDILMLNEMPMHSFVSEEVFFKSKCAVGADDFFDRNRFTMGLKIPINCNLHIEVSCANEIISSVNEYNVSVLQLNFVFNNFFFDCPFLVITP